MSIPICTSVTWLIVISFQNSKDELHGWIFLIDVPTNGHVFSSLCQYNAAAMVIRLVFHN